MGLSGKTVPVSGMCPGLGEWWLGFKNLVIFNIHAQTVSRIPCRHFVLSQCKVASKTKHFHLCGYFSTGQ